MDHGLGNQGSIPGWARDFPLLIQTSLGNYLAFFPVVTGANSPGIRWPTYDHSPLSSAEVRNMFYSNPS
jgi:hypothetical protein